MDTDKVLKHGIRCGPTYAQYLCRLSRCWWTEHLRTGDMRWSKICVSSLNLITDSQHSLEVSLYNVMSSVMNYLDGYCMQFQIINWSILDVIQINAVKEILLVLVYDNIVKTQIYQQPTWFVLFVHFWTQLLKNFKKTEGTAVKKIISILSVMDLVCSVIFFIIFYLTIIHYRLK